MTDIRNHDRRRQKLRWILPALLLAGLVAVIYWVFDVWLGYREAFLQEYQRAQVLATGSDHTLMLKNKVSVSITSKSEGPYPVLVRFSDETEPREASHVTDYVYPSEIRVSNERRYLFVKHAGLAGGIYKSAHICQFDLQQRRIVREVSVSP